MIAVQHVADSAAATLLVQQHVSVTSLLPGADAAHDDSPPQRRSARAGKGRKRPASSLEEDLDFALDEGQDLDEEPASRLQQLTLMPAARESPALVNIVLDHKELINSYQQQRKRSSASFTACLHWAGSGSCTCIEAQQVGGSQVIEELGWCGLQAARQQVDEGKQPRVV